MSLTASASAVTAGAAQSSGGGRGVRRASPWIDVLFSAFAHGAAWLTLALLAAILVSLVFGAAPAIREYGLAFLWTSEWDPVQNRYGGLVMIYGTLMTSAIALVIAVPVSFGIALFLTELSPLWLKRPLGTAIELLAAVPSIVYGMWGLLVFSPILSQYVHQPLQAVFKGVPLLGELFSGPPVGIGLLSAGIILAIMVIPFIASVMRDVFEVTPPMLKESAMPWARRPGRWCRRSCCPTPRPAWSAASCSASGAPSVKRWRSPSSSATSTSSARCSCSRPPTALPRPLPMSSAKPHRACTRPR